MMKLKVGFYFLLSLILVCSCERKQSNTGDEQQVRAEETAPPGGGVTDVGGGGDGIAGQFRGIGRDLNEKLKLILVVPGLDRSTLEQIKSSFGQTVDNVLIEPTSERISEWLPCFLGASRMCEQEVAAKHDRALNKIQISSLAYTEIGGDFSVKQTLVMHEIVCLILGCDRLDNMETDEKFAITHPILAAIKNLGSTAIITGSRFIKNCKELQSELNKSTQNNPGRWVLTQDIDCSETKTWNNGKGFFPIAMFRGVLDGRGFAIKNLFVNQSLVGTAADRYMSASLIYACIQCRISNLWLDSVDITGNHAAGLVSGITLGDVNNVYVTGSVTSTLGGAGGIAVLNSGSITYSASEVRVQSLARSADDRFGFDSPVGGIASSSTGVIENCTTKSWVKGLLSVGGLVGWNHSGGAILNSYSNSTVAGVDYVGGLVGIHEFGNISLSNAKSKIRIEAVGARPSAIAVGGLVGLVNGTSIEEKSVIRFAVSSSEICGATAAQPGIGLQDGEREVLELNATATIQERCAPESQ